MEASFGVACSDVRALQQPPALVAIQAPEVSVLFREHSFLRRAEWRQGRSRQCVRNYSDWRICSDPAWNYQIRLAKIRFLCDLWLIRLEKGFNLDWLIIRIWLAVLIPGGIRAFSRAWNPLLFTHCLRCQVGLTLSVFLAGLDLIHLFATDAQNQSVSALHEWSDCTVSKSAARGFNSVRRGNTPPTRRQLHAVLPCSPSVTHLRHVRPSVLPRLNTFIVNHLAPACLEIAKFSLVAYQAASSTVKLFYFEHI